MKKASKVFVVKVGAFENFAKGLTVFPGLGEDELGSLMLRTS